MANDENKTRMTPSYDAMTMICKCYYPFVNTKEIKNTYSEIKYQKVMSNNIPKQTFVSFCDKFSPIMFMTSSELQSLTYSPPYFLFPPPPFN